MEKRSLEDRIDELERELRIVKRENRRASHTINELKSHYHDMITRLFKMDEIIDAQFNRLFLRDNILFATVENLPYELFDPSFDRKHLFYPTIISNDETIQQILNDGKSLARFGECELDLMISKQSDSYQSVNEKLAARLKEVLSIEHPRLLIGISDNYGSLDKYVEATVYSIRFFLHKEHARNVYEQMLDNGRIYCNTHITRPYVLFKDNKTDAPKKRFEKLKLLWAGRNVIMIEGNQTRMGVGNDLFDGATEIKRIIAPAINAFDRYDDLLSAAIKHGSKDTLFLLALGPTATVLTYDLVVNGFQALDVGHVDLEYEWFLAGKGVRTSVPYKYNNELSETDVEDIDDPVYESQIIERCY